jgi:hypothetical protein
MSQRSVTFAFCLLAPLAAAAERSSEPGLMLREGNWGGDAGTYLVPTALQNVSPGRWPADGWNRLTIARDRVVVAASPGQPRQRPAFLESIVAQVEAFRNGTMPQESSSPASDDIYLRVPGAALVYGASPAYVFRNGTTMLRPMLDHRYELQLGTTAFALTVQNGKRTANGTPYGGALYIVEVDGASYEYLLGEFGWDSTIEAIADIDGDGKPDFIVRVAGSNGDHEVVLLSSQAKPGMNPATASLLSVGC